jgi:phage terminase small subunit
MADGVNWLARTDAPALALLRSMLEEREGLRDLAFQGSNESRKALRDLDKQIVSLLSNLGFDPAARARLGLAEVKTKSVLEQLREKRT